MKKPSRLVRSHPHEPTVRNALLRCLRSDNKPAPHFERIEAVEDLWVMELGPFRDPKWSSWLGSVYRILSGKREFLESLHVGNSDYTLHIAVTISDVDRTMIPPSLMAILASAGISIEIYHAVY